MFFNTAWSAQKYFRSWSVKEGLPQSLVYSISRDAQGYIWLATYGAGICRFDGKHFYSYSLKEGLKDHRVRVIKSDKINGLWIGTENAGVIYFDGSNFQTVLGKEIGSVKCLLIDKQNRKWIGTTSGLFSLQDQQVKKHLDISVNALDFSQDNLVVGGRNGEVLIGALSDQVKFNPIPGIKDPLTLLTVDQQARIWTGSGKQILLFDLQGNNQQLPFEDVGINYRPISGFCDSKGTVWIGTEGGGVLKFTEERSQVLNTQNGLGSDIVTAFYEDNQGNIWVGTEGGGFSKYHISPFTYYSSEDGLSNNKITAIAAVKKGKIFAGTLGNGITEIQDEKIKQNQQIKTGFVMSILVDSKGHTWIGTIGEGLLKITKDNRVERFKDEHGFGEGRITRIYEEKQGVIWFAIAGKGVSRYENGVFHHFGPSHGLKAKEVFDIGKSPGDKMLFASLDQGLVQFKNNSFSSYNHELGGKRIVAFSVVEQVLWAGTDGDGLIGELAGQHYNFTTDDGLASNYISFIIPEDQQRLWIGTDKGLSKLEVVVNSEGIQITQIRHYGLESGLPTIETSLNAAAKDELGNLWFGTIDGLIRYDPKTANAHFGPPLTIISGIKIFQEPFDGNNQSKPAFSYDQNHVTFDFIGISYDIPEQVRYSYRLNPLEKEWSPLSEENQATYSSLPPGNYKFEVKSIYQSNPNLDYQTTADYSFSITPPFWKTSWFYGILSVASVILIFMVVKWREYQMKQREQVLEREVADRTGELVRKNKELQIAREAADRAREAEEQFIANVSHEMRTPMNAIIGLSNLMVDSKLPEKEKEYVQSIRFSAGNLLAMINDILDMSKIEEGKMEFQHKSFSVGVQMKELIQAIKIKAEEKKLNLEFKLDENIPDTVIGDAVRLNQVLLNLLDNAIKFTDKGWVKLEVRKLSDREEDKDIWLEFMVSDSGKGIASEFHQVIFERFKQLSQEKQRLGSGLGLAIVKKIVTLQQGSIKVNSQPGKGSVFTINIPFRSGMTSSKQVSTVKTARDFSNTNIRILVAEDNPLNLMVVEGFLQKWGMVYDIALNGQQAVDMHKKNHYDLILMDVNMPVMNGCQATENIRQLNGKSADVPVIGITAYYTKADVKKCEESGMNDYLAKPFEPEDLFQKIARYAQRVDLRKATENGFSINNKDKVLSPDPAELITNLSFLKNLNDEKAIKDIVSLFIHHTPTQIEDLKRFSSEKDWESFRKTVHNLNSNVQYVGIASLKEEIHLMGKYAKEQTHLDQIQEIICKTEVVCQKAINELKSTFLI